MNLTANKLLSGTIVRPGLGNLHTSCILLTDHGCKFSILWSMMHIQYVCHGKCVPQWLVLTELELGFDFGHLQPESGNARETARDLAPRNLTCAPAIRIHRFDAIDKIFQRAVQLLLILKLYPSIAMRRGVVVSRRHLPFGIPTCRYIAPRPFKDGKHRRRSLAQMV